MHLLLQTILRRATSKYKGYKMKYNHFTLLVSATTLISALFVTACNDGVTVEKGANSSYAVSEYELSNGAAEYIDETHMAVLSLEHPDTQADQYDLGESGKDCFFIKTSKDLGDISIYIDPTLSIASLTIKDTQSDDIVTFTKDDGNNTYSFQADHVYEYCVNHDGSSKKHQPLFVYFDSSLSMDNALGDDQASINRLKTTGSCTGITCDLTHANLTGMMLQDANLSGARLNDATLFGADLSHADLRGTHLVSVNIEKAILDDTTIDYDHFSFTSIKDASFVGSTIVSFPTPDNATNIHYQGINFSHANLSNTFIQSITFEDCDFHEANFTNAFLNGSSFDNLNLAGAIFTGADMGDVSYKSADFSNAIWTDDNRCLEGVMGQCIQKSDDKPFPLNPLYHFHTPFPLSMWIGANTQGAGITIGDTKGDGKLHLTIFWIDNPNGENHAYYRISSDFKADGSVNGWTKHYEIPGWIGTHSEGGGIAIGDVDKNGKPNLIIFWVDNPSGANHAYYKVSSDIREDGSVESWSKHYEVPGWVGNHTEGAGIAIGDTDENGKPNLIVYWIDDPYGENRGRYRVSSDLHHDGSVKSWTEAYDITGHFGSENQGGGIAVGDYDGDGKPNFIVFYIDNPWHDNHGYCKISENINHNGSVSGWKDRFEVPGWFGWDSSGGGIAMGDYDGSGNPNLFIFHINNSSGENSANYRVGYFNNFF